MKYLSQKEMKHYADKYDVEEGEQIHVNHEDCPAGQDTKQRLYIKGVENGKQLYYCHHCGQRGSLTTRPYSTAQSAAAASRPVSAGSKHGGARIPRDAETDINQWPAEARLWIKQYGITAQEVKDNGIFYSPSVGRVGLPVWGRSGVSYISYRKVHRTDDGPKYLGYGKSVGGVVAAVSSSGGRTCEPTTIIIVEDKLSAIKCARVCDAMCLNGTYLDDAALLEIVRKYSNIYIFLDNDNRQVKLEQIRMKRVLEQYGKNVCVIKSKQQPKELTEHEIVQLLTAHS